MFDFYLIYGLYLLLSIKWYNVSIWFLIHGIDDTFTFEFLNIFSTSDTVNCVFVVVVVVVFVFVFVFVVVVDGDDDDGDDDDEGCDACDGRDEFDGITLVVILLLLLLLLILSFTIIFYNNSFIKKQTKKDIT